MGLKRKRSESTLSPSSNSSTSLRDSPSPPHFAGGWQSTAEDYAMADSSFRSQRVDHWTMSVNPFCDATPSHLHSRTRKRFRDNRPDESTIHENTFHKLYEAQRSQHSPVPAIPRPASISSTSSQKQAQSSLHSYWALPARPPVPQNCDFASPASHVKCEDCDALLGSADENAMDVDLDEAEYSCRGCHRNVCDICAVIEVGEGRKCLQCKTSRKKWIGGIGWM